MDQVIRKQKKKDKLGMQSIKGELVKELLHL